MNARSLLHLPLVWSRLRLALATPRCGQVQAETRAIRLRRHQVLTIASAAVAGRIQVQQGTVWLTATPGEKDVLLTAGTNLNLTNHYPFVLEALTGAEIVLAGRD